MSELLRKERKMIKRLFICLLVIGAILGLGLMNTGGIGTYEMITISPDRIVVMDTRTAVIRVMNVSQSTKEIVPFTLEERHVRMK